MCLIIHQKLTFKTLLIFIKGILQKNIILLVIKTNLASDNPLLFRKNLIERINKIFMTIDDKISDEKLQYDINREKWKNL